MVTSAFGVVHKAWSPNKVRAVHRVASQPWEYGSGRDVTRTHHEINWASARLDEGKGGRHAAQLGTKFTPPRAEPYTVRAAAPTHSESQEALRRLTSHQQRQLKGDRWTAPDARAQHRAKAEGYRKQRLALQRVKDPAKPAVRPKVGGPLP